MSTVNTIPGHKEFTFSTWALPVSVPAQPGLKGSSTPPASGQLPLGKRITVFEDFPNCCHTGPDNKSFPVKHYAYCYLLLCSVDQLYLNFCNSMDACQASLSFSISWSLLKLMSIESVMPSNHLILCRPFSSCPQSFPASASFPMSQLFQSGCHSTGASVSPSVLPMNIQGLFL